MSGHGAELTVLDRQPRPTGTPPQCRVCNAICEPSLAGPVLCTNHRPREQGSAQGQAARLAIQRAKRAREAAPIVRAIPLLAAPLSRTDRHLMTLRERLRERRERGPA